MSFSLYFNKFCCPFQIYLRLFLFRNLTFHTKCNEKYQEWIIVYHQCLLFFSLTFAHSILTHVYVLPTFNFCVCDEQTPAGCCISTILGWYHWIWSYWKSVFINLEVCQSQNRILRPMRGGKMIVGINNNAKERYL